MYEPPSSELTEKPYIKNIGLVKVLLCLFVFLGFIESLGSIDLSEITKMDVGFVVFYVAISVLLAWLVWREMLTRPERSYKFALYVAVLIILPAVFNLYDADSNVLLDTVIVSFESLVMILIAALLKEN